MIPDMSYLSLETLTTFDLGGLTMSDGHPTIGSVSYHFPSLENLERRFAPDSKISSQTADLRIALVKG